MRTNRGARNIFLVVFPIIINILTIHNRETHGQIDDAAEYQQVEIPQGKLRGVNFTTYHKRVVHGFMGIPYAQPPIGNLRFRAPLPASAWNGTFDATKDADMCPQLSKGRVVGDEDCLYLNVYTPQLPSTDQKLLPVMVWIHGGGFANGSGISTETDPTYVMDRDVILVSPNYRLGLLGCLSTGDHVAPGNYGMKDKVLVLKWVRDNIIHFGGDSGRVTILGISSGGASVNLLAMSDLANGLFHRYIQMSGSALAPWAFAPRSTLARHSYRFGGYLNCPTNTSVSMIDCLREFNASYIMGMARFFEWDANPDPIWRPTDELEAEGAFLTDSPANLYDKGKIKDLPCISGVVREDGLWSSRHFYNDDNAFDDFLNNIDDDLPSLLLYEDRGDAAARTAAFKSYYLNDFSANRNLLLDNLTELLSDTFYFYPAYNAHRKQFSLGQSPQYLYSFEYKGSFQLRINASASTDIEHADEECFLFPIREFCCKRGLSDCEISESDSKMIDVMVDLWTSFAANGTPQVSSTDVAVNWEPYSTEVDNYLRIGNGVDAVIEMKKYFFKDRMQFWNDLSLKKLESKTSIVDFEHFCSTADHERSNLTTFQSLL